MSLAANSYISAQVGVQGSKEQALLGCPYRRILSFPREEVPVCSTQTFDNFIK
jgi:hypothetical protein